MTRSLSSTSSVARARCLLTLQGIGIVFATIAATVLQLAVVVPSVHAATLCDNTTTTLFIATSATPGQTVPYTLVNESNCSGTCTFKRGSTTIWSSPTNFGTYDSTTTAPASPGSYTYSLECNLNNPNSAQSETESKTMVVSPPGGAHCSDDGVSQLSSDCSVYDASRASCVDVWVEAAWENDARCQCKPAYPTRTMVQNDPDQKYYTCTASGPTPTIDSFTRSPATITLGGSSTLTWTSTNAANCTLSGEGAPGGNLAADGSTSVTPTSVGTKTYTLTCGSATSSVSVTVNPAAAASVDSFSAAPTNITLGDSTTLTWTSSNAASCTITATAGGVPPSGTLAADGNGTATPSSTGTKTYTINCGGTTATTTVTVYAAPPTPTGVTATANSSSQITIAWTTPGTSGYTTRIRYTSPTTGPLVANIPAGTKQYVVTGLSPSTTYGFRLFHDNGAGDQSSPANVSATTLASAVQPTVDSFTLNGLTSGISVPAGSTINLAWTSTNATSCTIESTPGYAADGSTTGTAPWTAGSYSYSLFCTGPGGNSATVVRNFTVTAAPVDSVDTFTASPTTITLGQSTTLAWTSTNAANCTMASTTGGGHPTGTLGADSSGTATPTTTGTKTYTITCGTATRTVNVTVNTATPTIDSFSASPIAITLGQSSTLTWTSSNAANCTLSGEGAPGGNLAADGNAAVTPTTTGTKSYILNCWGATNSVNVTVDAAATPEYSWYVEGWSQCSGSCGGSGTQTRDVYCHDENTGARASDSACSGTKPASSQACSMPPCTVPQSSVTDIGLKVSHAGVVSAVACSTDLSQSPLRITKNGVTYAVLLVNLDDPMALGYRVHTSQGVKALKKMISTPQIGYFTFSDSTTVKNLSAWAAYTLRWSAPGADQCVLSGNGSQTYPGSSQSSVPGNAPTTPGDYLLDLTCSSAGGVSPARSVTIRIQVTGACGTAERNYVYTASGYAGLTQCAAGTPSTPWDFPPQGGSATWTCYGQNGGANDVCTATRNPPPPVTTFTVNGGSSATIVRWQSVSFSWSATNSPSGCTASSSPSEAGWNGAKATSGSNVSHTPSTSGTKTYSLYCTNVSGNSPTRSVTVTVNDPPASITNFSYTDNTTSKTAPANTALSLKWASTDATTCTLAGVTSGTYGPNQTSVAATAPSSPGSYSWTLTCSGPGGASATRTVTLTVNPTSGYDCSQYHEEIVHCNPVTSRASCFTSGSPASSFCQCNVGAKTGVADPEPDPNNEFTYWACYTYSWQTGVYGACSATACGTSGTQTRSVWCQRNDGATVADGNCTTPKPATSQTCSAPACATPTVDSFAASPTTITVGQSTTLSWTSTNAANCTLSGENAPGGNLAADGSQSVTPSTTGTKTYTVTCGSATRTVNVTVNAAALSCGSSHNTYSWASAPTSNLCSDGSTPTVTYVQPTVTAVITPATIGRPRYTWTCGSNNCAAYAYTLASHTTDWGAAGDPTTYKCVVGDTSRTTMGTNGGGSSPTYLCGAADAAKCTAPYVTVFVSSADGDNGSDTGYSEYYRCETAPGFHNNSYAFGNGSAQPIQMTLSLNSDGSWNMTKNGNTTIYDTPQSGAWYMPGVQSGIGSSYEVFFQRTYSNFISWACTASSSAWQSLGSTRSITLSATYNGTNGAGEVECNYDIMIRQTGQPATQRTYSTMFIGSTS